MAESAGGLSKAEKQAISDRARETSPKKKKNSGASDMAEKISLMTPAEQDIARRLAELISRHAPDLEPSTWYGMPAWKKAGKTICFFQAASKFGARYNTFGFDEHATIDSGQMWATSFALTELTPEAEEKLMALVKKAV